MSEQNAGAPDGTQGTVTTTASAEVGAAAQADATQPGEPWLNKNEFIALAKEVRELKKAAQGRTAEPKKTKSEADADALAEVQTLRGELALRDTISDLGVTLSQSQREVVQRLYRVDRPEDPAEWLRKTVAAFQPATPAATSPPPERPRAQVKTDTGPPGATVAAGAEWGSIPIDVWRAMSRDDKKKAWNSHLRASGLVGNRFKKE